MTVGAHRGACGQERHVPRWICARDGGSRRRFKLGDFNNLGDFIAAPFQARRYEHLHQDLPQARGESMEKFDRGIRSSILTTPLTRGLQDSSNVRDADITDGDSELISTIPSVERCAIEFPSSCSKHIGFQRLDLRGRLKH